MLKKTKPKGYLKQNWEAECNLKQENLDKLVQREKNCVLTIVSRYFLPITLWKAAYIYSDVVEAIFLLSHRLDASRHFLALIAR